MKDPPLKTTPLLLNFAHSPLEKNSEVLLVVLIIHIIDSLMVSALVCVVFCFLFFVLFLDGTRGEGLF